MNPKELKKLVKLCRDMGVKHYKGDGFEFTLTDEAPVSKKAAAAKLTHEQPEVIESDMLTPEQLMWWSIGDDPTQESETP